MKLLILALLSAEPNATVTPCGNAACVSTYQTPVTLGGTVQVNQGFWPDGGIARIIPVVPGATMSVSGNQVHDSTVPDVTLHSTVTRDSTVPIVSVKNKQVQVFAVLGDGTVTGPSTGSSFVTIDAGQEYVQNRLQVGGVLLATNPLTAGTFPCDGGTPAPTVPVTAGVHCVCGGLGAACTVSSTTMTAHCVAGDSVGVGYICL